MTARDIILNELSYGPRTVAKICRQTNRKQIWFCAFCRYYANPRKRKNFSRIHEVPCRPTYATFMRAARELEKEGLITRERVKKSDPRNNRGWDFMNVLRLKNSS